MLFYFLKHSRFACFCNNVIWYFSPNLNILQCLLSFLLSCLVGVATKTKILDWRSCNSPSFLTSFKTKRVAVLPSLRLSTCAKRPPARKGAKCDQGFFLFCIEGQSKEAAVRLVSWSLAFCPLTSDKPILTRIVWDVRFSPAYSISSESFSLVE